MQGDSPDGWACRLLGRRCGAEAVHVQDDVDLVVVFVDWKLIVGFQGPTNTLKVFRWSVLLRTSVSAD